MQLTRLGNHMALAANQQKVLPLKCNQAKECTFKDFAVTQTYCEASTPAKPLHQVNTLNRLTSTSSV